MKSIRRKVVSTIYLPASRYLLASSHHKLSCGHERMILHRSFFPEPVPKTLVCFDCTNKAARTRTLPEGVYQRKGLGGVGIQLYRVVGSCLGDVEEPMGFGRTLADAIADCKKKGNWPV